MEDAPQYYLCLEYHTDDKKYGRSYISFGPDGLIYDTIYKYTLEQIDFFLEIHQKDEILKQAKKDNVLYFLKEEEDLQHTTITIRHYDIKNGKERISAEPLPKGCYFFNMEKYLKEYLTTEERKNLHNKLGGYVTNPHTEEKMKTFIRNLPSMDAQGLYQLYQGLSYIERRTIKTIIYTYITEDKRNLLIENSPHSIEQTASKLLRKAA